MENEEKQKNEAEEGSAGHAAGEEGGEKNSQKAEQGTGEKEGAGGETPGTDRKKNEKRTGKAGNTETARDTGKTENTGTARDTGKAESAGGNEGTGKDEKAGNERETDKAGNEQVKIAELQGLLIKKTEELTKAGERLAKLERAAAEANERSVKLDANLKQAVISYKTLIASANPDVLPEMVTGDSIEDLDASLAKARELIGKIKTGLESQSQASRVPAGAPQRGAADLSGMSARDKIRIGLERAGR